MVRSIVSKDLSRPLRSPSRPSSTFGTMLRCGIAADVERGVGRAEPGRAVTEDAAQPDIRGQAGASVAGAAMTGKDGADAGLDRRLAVVGGREVVAGHHPVRAAAVAGVVVGERADKGHLVGMLAPSAGTPRRSRCRGHWSSRPPRCCGTRPGRSSWDRRFQRGWARRRARARRPRCSWWPSRWPSRRRGIGEDRATSIRPGRERRP